MMGKDRIGVIVDSFRVGLREGIKKAKEVGATGIQLYAVSGETDPENLKPAARQELLDFIKSNDLVVSALCGDLGGHGFARREENAWKIEKSKRILELARDLETRIVTTHIGVVPGDRGSDRRKITQEACRELGELAERMGGFFAIETGPEKTALLKEFLDSLGTRGIGVNYDPANLVMVTGEDPVAGVYNLRDYIVHTHAKDGIMKKQEDPEVIYNFFAEGGICDVRLSDYFIETPLGQGQVDFPRYVKALEDIGYKGFFTIEREVGEDPEKDIREAVRFLQGIL